jgi:hypothetical protein
MMPASWLVRRIWAIGVVVGLCLSGPGRAEAKKDKDDAKAKPAPKSQVVPVDLSKLPPDVAKRLKELGIGAPDKPAAKPEPAKPEPAKPAAKPEPAKPAAKPAPGNKLPPGLAKKEKAEDKKPEDGKGGGKAISLIEAIAIAEKSGHGKVVKAEAEEDDGTVQFKLELVGKDGKKSRIELDAAGKILKDEASRGARPPAPPGRTPAAKPAEKKEDPGPATPPGPGAG